MRALWEQLQTSDNSVVHISQGKIWISFETTWALHTIQKVKIVSGTFQQLIVRWDVCISHSPSIRSQEGRLSSIVTGKLLLTLIWHRPVKRFAVPVGPYYSKEKGHTLGIISAGFKRSYLLKGEVSWHSYKTHVQHKINHFLSRSDLIFYHKCR